MLFYPSSFHHQCRLSGLQACSGLRGFALVVSLLLMAFLFLLMVSLATLLHVELATATRQQNAEKAKQYAWLGLNVAIGELQRNLGPDTRVSARAEILDGGSDTIQHPYWTGVWQALPDEDSPEGVDPRSRPEILGWLISGNERDATLFNPSMDLEDEGSIVLARLITPDGKPPESYSAIRVPVVETGEGAYAYWVSDEGVKAKLNAVASHHAAPGQPMLPLGAPSGVILPELDEILDDPGLLSRLMTLSQVEKDSSVRRSLYPDTTLYGAGVQADSLRGGLRFDLSAVMAMPPDTVASELVPLLPGSRMFDPYIISGTASRGPEWGDLTTYVKITQAAAGTDGYTVQPTEFVGGRLTQVGVFPLIERFQLYVVGRLSDNLNPGDPDNAEYRPRLYMMPAVVLWNPYDKPLVAPDGYHFSLKMSTTEVGANWQYYYDPGYYEGTDWEPLPVTGGVSGGNGAVLGAFPETLANREDKRLLFKIRSNEGSTVTLQPGEGRVFTLTSSVPIGNAGPFILEPGFRDFGLYQDADHSFRVNETVLAGGDIYLDLRYRGWQISNDSDPTRIFGPPDVSLELELPGGSRLQEIGILRILDREPARPTVSEQNPSPGFGDDEHGTEPFVVSRNSIPPDNVPAYSIIEDVAFGYEAGLKTPESKLNNTTTWRAPGERPLSRINLRAYRNGPDNVSSWFNYTGGYDNNQSPGYGAVVLLKNTNIGHFANANYIIDTWGDDNSNTYVGYGDEASHGVTHAVYFHLPESGWSPVSVGDLRYFDMVGHDSGLSIPRYNLGPTFVVGEASADPFVSRPTLHTRPLSQYATDQRVDYQWLANRALWDRFFVSTVPALISEITFPLPNGLMVPMDITGGTATGEEMEALRDFRRAASHLMVNGAFNVNSTSVRAWEALYSRYFGNDVELVDGSSESGVNHAAFLTRPGPQFRAYTGGDTSTPELYSGYRRLNHDEIHDLAKSTVEEIKRRGPFGNLADFVNRSINPDDAVFLDTRERGVGVLATDFSPADLSREPRLFGTLQAAIEKAGLNDDLVDDYYIRGNIDPWSFGSTQSTAGAFGAFMEAAPGYLTQGALMARLGPMLSARSDTFTIRVYGGVKNSLTGKTEAQAWCEAVVQRLPDLMDSSQSPETRPEDWTAINRDFGRRFVVTEFRWLKEDEL